MSPTSKDPAAVDPSPDALLQQVRETAQGFDVFGELGRHADTDIWYLGRERASATLVALRLRQQAGSAQGPPVFDLEVARELNASVALGIGDCPQCHAAVRAWARFCGKCGADLSGAAPLPRDPTERAALLEQVRAAAGDVYDVLGEMPWAGGGGIVYFAVEKDTARLVRLRLQASGGDMALGETRSMVPLERLAADYVSQVNILAVPVPPAPPEVAAAGASAPTAAHRVRSRRPRVGVIAGVIAAVVMVVAALLLLG